MPLAKLLKIYIDYASGTSHPKAPSSSCPSLIYPYIASNELCGVSYRFDIQEGIELLYHLVVRECTLRLCQLFSVSTIAQSLYV